MKKMQFFSFILISFLLNFFSCAKKNTNLIAPVANINLALRSGVYTDVVKNCLPDFEQKYNIKCNILELSEEDLHKNIVNDSNNVEGNYDLCMVDSSWMAEFTESGILTELSALGYLLDSDIIPATTTICYSKGGLYLAPFYGNVSVLLYNKLMIQEAGYKAEDIQSLEDILNICRFQKKRHNLGFLYRGDTENNLVVDFLPILCSKGAWVVDENNNPTVNNQAFLEAMYFYLDLIKTGKDAKKDDLITAVSNKSATMGIGWPGWYLQGKNSSMEYMALTGKFRDDRPAYNSNIYGIWTLGIPQNSKNKKYAIELLKFLMDKEVQKASINYGGVPCRYSCLQDKEILEKYPHYKVVCQALENGIYRPVMKEWPQFYTILGNQMRAIINGEKLVREGLDDAQTELEILMIK